MLSSRTGLAHAEAADFSQPIPELREASQAADKASAKAHADEDGAPGRAANLVPLPVPGAPAPRSLEGRTIAPGAERPARKAGRCSLVDRQ
jgi:hypothetical protein